MRARRMHWREASWIRAKWLLFIGLALWFAVAFTACSSDDNIAHVAPITTNGVLIPACTTVREWRASAAGLGPYVFRQNECKRVKGWWYCEISRP